MILQNRIALVTGGGSGIGLATAKRFTEEGAHVFISGRRAAELEKARAAIGAGVTAVRCDVTDLKDLDDLYARIRADRGVIDIVVANAGICELASIDDATPEHFDRIFAINARGTFFTVQKALPLMTRGGSIVLVSSAVHPKGYPTVSVYAASKAALRSFARTWAAELAGRGIRVNCLSPGPVDTPMLIGDPMAEDPSPVPLKRVGRSDEIANAALFLASEQSSFCTGIDLVSDGGITQI